MIPAHIIAKNKKQAV